MAEKWNLRHFSNEGWFICDQVHDKLSALYVCWQSKLQHIIFQFSVLPGGVGAEAFIRSGEKMKHLLIIFFLKLFKDIDFLRHSV